MRKIREGANYASKYGIYFAVPVLTWSFVSYRKCSTGWRSSLYRELICLFVCFSTEGEVDAAEAYQPTGGTRHHATWVSRFLWGSIKYREERMASEVTQTLLLWNCNWTCYMYRVGEKLQYPYASVNKTAWSSGSDGFNGPCLLQRGKASCGHGGHEQLLR